MCRWTPGGGCWLGAVARGGDRNTRESETGGAQQRVVVALPEMLRNEFLGTILNAETLYA
jgi:hypothetical protein